MDVASNFTNVSFARHSCVPQSEKHPDADKECALEAIEDVEAVVGTLTRVAEQMAKPLMTIVHSCPSRDAVANASLALAKLSSTNQTCDILLEQGVAKIAASMFPEKPSILEGPMGAKHIMDEVYDVEAKNKRDAEVDQLVSLDASAFRLVASLCRTVKGRQAVQTSGMMRRCVERFHLSGGVKGVDLVCRGEIACVFARTANAHTVESGTAGSANDYILNPNYNTVALLVELVREGSKFYRRARFWAAFALAELCNDTVRVVPIVAKWKGVPALVQIVKDYTRGGGVDPRGIPQPLLRPVLMALMRICKFPMGGYTSLIIEAEARQPLAAIASNVRLQVEYRDVKDREPLGR